MIKKNEYILGISLIALMLVASTMFTSIKVGQEGLTYNRLSGNVEVNLSPGWHFVSPLKSVEKYDLKIQKASFENIEGLSQDSQAIRMNIVVNWRYDGAKLKEIYSTIKGNPEDTVMYNAVIGSLKASLGKFDISEIARNRDVLKKNMIDELRTSLNEYHIIVDNVEVVNIDFSEKYDDAIEAKKIAEQQALEAQNKVAKVKYESEAKALENTMVAKTITPMMLKQKWLEKWDGRLPQVMNGSSSGIMIDLTK